MRCDRIMKRDVQALRPEDEAQHAARTMRECGIGFMPVIDPEGKVLGALTDRDIVVRICADGRPLTTGVDEFYTHECVAVRPDDDVSVAEDLMAEHRKSRVLVTERDGRLCGVISLSDIAEREGGAHAAHTLVAVAARETRPEARPHEAPWKAERVMGRR